MKRTPVESSMIVSAGYDKQAKILEVEFVNTGQVYQYFEVPYAVYQDLMEAPSKGTYMRSGIIDQYDCAEVKR